MTLAKQQLWDRFCQRCSHFPALDLSLDLSRMNYEDTDCLLLYPQLQQAFAAMAALESGAIANPDEHRKVGHYWLRNPALAPDPEIRRDIEQTQKEITEFARQIHAGTMAQANIRYTDVLIIGIGGSALGSQFLAHALGHPDRDRMRLHFFDNTDPDGIDRVLSRIGGPQLAHTLCVVISKSGGTKETRNGMLEAKAAYARLDIDFASHSVAVTGRDSELDKLAQTEGWLRRFPMWDWVGGRTSVTSAVGLLPAALQGIDVTALLHGAGACDEITRIADLRSNPAAQLAVMWHYAGQGRGLKDMVIIPYKDRLEPFSKYLQQLVMESLGKELDTQGNIVNQGIAVYGNKGSTDQHAYIQQLRDGINNFFVTFIRVLKDREGDSLMVEPHVTSGDYLDGFLLGTRKALFGKKRESILLTIREVSPFSVGVLIALYERAVGFYASLVGINAYHQPGVEAGKRAAGDILEVQRRTIEFLDANRGKAFAVETIARALGAGVDPETVFHIMEHLAANPDRGILKRNSETFFESEYQAG